MTKHALIVAGLIGFAALTGCATEPPYRGECYGNNCRHGYGGDDHLHAMNWQGPIDGERSA